MSSAAEPKDRYSKPYDIAPVGYLTLSCDALILEADLIGAALLGVARDELINQNFKRFIASADVDMWNRHMISVCRDGDKQNCDLRIGRPDGLSFYVHMTSIRVDLPATGDRPSDFGVRTMMTRPSFGMRTMMSDIVMRKRMEEDLEKAYNQLKEAEQKLAQSEKISAVGRFSGWIAHEVKNPMGIALGALELLEKKLASCDEGASRLLATIKGAVLRANSILEEFLNYDKTADLKSETANISDIVGLAVDTVKARADLSNVTIAVDFAHGLRVSADKNQLNQALSNIVNNAMEAMSYGGKLSFKTYKSPVLELPGEDMACVVEVSDTGAGIPQGNMSKVTEPFFTTKKRGIGTGLGLFIANKIIENHNGKLLIKSAEGKGTVVKIVLPLAN